MAQNRNQLEAKFRKLNSKRDRLGKKTLRAIEVYNILRRAANLNINKSKSNEGNEDLRRRAEKKIRAAEKQASTVSKLEKRLKVANDKLTQAQKALDNFKEN